MLKCGLSIYFLKLCVYDVKNKGGDFVKSKMNLQKCIMKLLNIFALILVVQTPILHI